MLDRRKMLKSSTFIQRKQQYPDLQGARTEHTVAPGCYFVARKAHVEEGRGFRLLEFATAIR